MPRASLSACIGAHAIAGVWWARIAEHVIDAPFEVFAGRIKHCRNAYEAHVRRMKGC